MHGLGTRSRARFVALGLCCAAALGCNPHAQIISASDVPRCAPVASREPRLIVRRVFLGSPRFRLASARVELDNVEVYNAPTEASVAQPWAVVYDAPAGWGPHTLSGEYKLIFRGPVTDKHLTVPFRHQVNVPQAGTACSSLTLYITDDASIPVDVFTKLDERE
ncbi:MAG TPA: hypothetical protein VGM29_04340, partial [Polyangiaceae bacterium]